MSGNKRRGQLYAEFRARGGQPDRHYREYSEQDLLHELEKLGYVEPRYDATTSEEVVPPSPSSEATIPAQPIPEMVFPSEPDPEELPGQRLNTKAEDEVIRVDDQGRAWLQEEVKKPAYPKPRGRRVLTYRDTGVAKETVQNGDYTETFEIAGNRAERPSEVKITLPSYQVGIYKDPRFPFKVHCYNGREGFNLFDVNDFYGGAELVPAGVKRIYIENDLCYDIRSVILAINEEHRHLQLTGKIQ